VGWPATPMSGSPPLKAVPAYDMVTQAGVVYPFPKLPPNYEPGTAPSQVVAISAP